MSIRYQSLLKEIMYEERRIPRKRRLLEDPRIHVISDDEECCEEIRSTTARTKNQARHSEKIRERENRIHDRSVFIVEDEREEEQEVCNHLDTACCEEIRTTTTRRKTQANHPEKIRERENRIQDRSVFIVEDEREEEQEVCNDIDTECCEEIRSTRRKTQASHPDKITENRLQYRSVVIVEDEREEGQEVGNHVVVLSDEEQEEEVEEQSRPLQANQSQALIVVEDAECNERPDNGKYDKFRIERDEKRSLLFKMKRGSKRYRLRDICISCETTDNIKNEHPMFEGGICSSCLRDWKVEAAKLGRGEEDYCIVCTNGGDLFECAEPSCELNFCTGCIRDFMSSDRVRAIRMQDNWLCFVCTEYTPNTHGFLKPREEWIRCNRGQVAQIVSRPVVDPAQKRPIRVLSLFDGIGTCRVILNLLGIEVEKYFASEIDEDAKAVSAYRHEDIIHLGDVREITYEKLKKIAPIDLLIGGSPCPDFSRVNHARQGLEGAAGVLFFEYNRILTEIPHVNGSVQFFWLFENTANMDTPVYNAMNRYFRSTPFVWDAEHFTAMKRKRYFWGNLETLDKQFTMSGRRIEIADVLMGIHRQQNPAVRTIPTVTTNPYSTHSGPQPVYYNRQPDYLWITEIEKLFGFRAHYTDVHDMGPKKRQRLLGKAWAIPVVKHLLSPLRDYFTCSDAINIP